MRNKKAFTMIELIFVIIIMGILAKFGTEFLVQAYKHFISTNLQNRHQNQSTIAVEFIAKRLQYRIKNSVIEKDSAGNFSLLEGAVTSNNNVLEWVAYDIEGLRSSTWSGIYSKSASGDELMSPESNTSAVNDMIQTLSYANSTIADAAIYFIGSDSNKDTWGWDENDNAPFADLNKSMKPIKAGTDPNQFAANVTGGETFKTLDLNASEYNSYQLAWTANAIVFYDSNNTLYFHSDYQPWKGENYTQAKQRFLIMEEVSDFKKKQTKSVISIKICTSNKKLKSLDEGEFSTCKEKTIL